MIQINLNEAIRIVPKLMPEHLDLLTLSYVLTYVKIESIIDMLSFINFYKKYTILFSGVNLPKESTLQYLDYIGCGTILLGRMLEEIFKIRYPHIFSEIKDIKPYIISIYPAMEKVFKLWDETALRLFNLTSVGIIIGHANLKRKTNLEVNLSPWI